MRKPQLSLVETRVELLAAPQDPVRQAFDHWLYLNDKNPLRCKLGPSRRQVISAALALYDLETVLLAIEGMAAAPLDGKPESMRQAMRDIEWFLSTERYIERAAELGEQLRRDLAAPQVAPVPNADAGRTPEQQAEWEAARQRLLTRVRASRAGGQAAHG